MAAEAVSLACGNLGSLLSGIPLLEVDYSGFRETVVPAVLESLEYFGAELQVAVFAMVILLLDLFLPLRLSKHLAWVALIACLMPLGTIGHNYESIEQLEGRGASLFLGMMAIDPFANFFKSFFLLGSIPVILLSYVSKQLQGRRMGEYYFILLASIFGGMLMASATHFLMLFLSLELLSVCSYVLVGYLRADRRGAEAALKYIIYGSVAAAIMGFGFSLWYGLTGSGEISSLASILWDPESQIYSENALELRTIIAATVALLFIFIGFAYKMSTIPMHFWAPDVYEGAPTAITAFLSVLSKAAGFAIAIRFFSGLGGSIDGLDASSPQVDFWGFFDWRGLLILIAIVTMTFGNLAALWQKNLKRLMAYSSIAHAGYLMMGLTLLGLEADLTYTGPQTMAFYLLAYLSMNFGAFAVIILLENRVGSSEMESCAGLGRRAPFIAAGLTVFLFSLIGLPPTAGFMGKFHLLMGVIKVDQMRYYILALAAVINTAISAYYYLRIVKGMYFESSDELESLESPILGRVVVVGLLIMTFVLFLGAEGILKTTLDVELHL